MAIKKSDLYRKLWESCDELRGGMDASQYKDYVLTLLFIKYISDKYKNQKFADIEIPKGASFEDMVKLKGTDDIGDDINRKIIGAIAKKNDLVGTITKADFDDDAKLGTGKEKIDKLTNLISIFESKDLDFSKNKADGDDILGDAYEYLMKHFASESGKSKGQFYTPSEVSRILAKVIGISTKNAKSSTTVYDPTCGSGSLLLKVAGEASANVTLYGQEKDEATIALARMNMVLHQNAAAVKEVRHGNTLANPKHHDKDGSLKQFDYVVANPPFSDKKWANGLTPSSDEYGRFQDFGVPPDKNGDYSYLLHILRSLKSKGRGAVILPHGVLFRGNAEAEIREKLVKKGYIKGIIGLPANLFYGTGIPACIIILDKESASERKGIFMIDAGKGFLKDGNKNKLREQDIHKIVDAFNSEEEILGFSKFIPLKEIISNEFNLNIPRYIASIEKEVKQDIEAHLLGGISNQDINLLDKYWNICPSIKKSLFEKGNRENYSNLKISKCKINETIFEHPEFKEFASQSHATFESWADETAKKFNKVDQGDKPKKIILEIAENLLGKFPDNGLVDKYDVYQHLMVFWDEVMQDDVYLITAEGWETGKERRRLTKLNQKKKEVDIKGLAGIEGDLIPAQLLIDIYFKDEKEELTKYENSIEDSLSEANSLIEENCGEGEVLDEFETGKKASSSSIKSKKEEYLGLAFNSFFKNEYKKIIEIDQDADEKKAALLALETDDPKCYFSDKVRNKKGMITNSQVEKFVVDLTGIQKKELFNTSWKKKGQLETFYDYLTLNKELADLSKDRKKAFSNLQEKLSNIYEENKDSQEIKDLDILDNLEAYMTTISKDESQKKEILERLEQKAWDKYLELSVKEIKDIVINRKWIMHLTKTFNKELETISHRLAINIIDLVERYEVTLVGLSKDVEDIEQKVSGHLENMGFMWK